MVPGHDQAGHCRGGAAAGAALRQLGAVRGGAVLRPAHRHHGRVARDQVSSWSRAAVSVSVSCCSVQEGKYYFYVSEDAPFALGDQGSC